MAVPAGLSKILTNTAPKKINTASEAILRILSGNPNITNKNKVVNFLSQRGINGVLEELNSIDFCNPLGFILTQALPPGGIIETKLFGFATKITNFLNKIENSLDPLRKPNETEEEYRQRILSYQDSIEELRLLLEDIIPPEDIVDLIPGGEGLNRTIQDVNLVLVATSDVLDQGVISGLIINKITVLRALAAKLAPFKNPINVALGVIQKNADKINSLLRGFIKPEQFADDVLKIAKLVQSVDNAIAQIQKVVSLINRILKLINFLIKLYQVVVKILKKLKVPLATGGGGSPVISQDNASVNTQSDRISKSNIIIEDLGKIVTLIQTFLSSAVLVNIRKIRRELLRLRTNLNLLYQNLSACPYTQNDASLLNGVQNSIILVNNNIATLEQLFPTIVELNLALPSLYNGYQINIIKEEVVDGGVTLLRRRVIVSDQRGVMQYEGTPTFATDETILIKEGQYYIDKQTQTSTSAPGNDSPTDQEVIDVVASTGLDPNNTIGGPVTSI